MITCDDTWGLSTDEENEGKVKGKMDTDLKDHADWINREWDIMEDAPFYLKLRAVIISPPVPVRGGEVGSLHVRFGGADDRTWTVVAVHRFAR